MPRPNRGTGSAGPKNGTTKTGGSRYGCGGKKTTK